MNHETYIKLVAALNELAEMDRPCVLGICAFVRVHCKGEGYFDARDYLHDAFQRWPLFSGNIAYPVPHPTLPSKLAYYNNHYYNSNENWNTDTEYGRNRWALVAFLLEDLAKGRPQI